MLRTRLIILLVVGVFIFLGATEVMADPFPPQSCTAGTYTISIDPNAPVAVTSMNDANFNEYPCWIVAGVTPCAFPYYVYPYNISSTSNISRIIELLPVCKNPINVLATSPQSGATLPPGQPDGKFKTWPVGIYDSFELAWTSNPSSGKFWVATNTSGLDINSMALGSGNTLYFCPNGIAGPGCGQPGFVPLSLEVKLQLGSSQICVSKDTGGCIKDVYECDGSYHYPLTPIQDSTWNGETVQYAGTETSGGQCATTILVTTGSPTCYPIVSGGYTTKVCYCSTNADCAQCGFTSCVSGKCR